jgi:predicted metal-dependent hydrolase
LQSDSKLPDSKHPDSKLLDSKLLDSKLLDSKLLNAKLPEDWFERFEHGLAEFNEGKFYDCHETLEQCWQEQGRLEQALPNAIQDPHRQWVQGFIQIAVAFHHLERDNVKGALKLLGRGFARIKKFPLITYPLELGPFEAVVKSTIDELEALGEPPTGQIKVQFPKVVHK